MALPCRNPYPKPVFLTETYINFLVLVDAALFEALLLHFLLDKHTYGRGSKDYDIGGTNMIKIDTKKCIGCGACVKECHIHMLALESGKAKLAQDCGLLCGHCVAVCPTNAFEIPEYDMADVTDIAAQNFTADDIVSFIKSRRSTRQFQDRNVDKEIIKQVIEAGRYTPTSANRQELAFVVIDEKMQNFREFVIEAVKEQCRGKLAAENTPPFMKMISQRAIAIADKYRQNPDEKDEMFFSAPLVILIAGDNEFDAGLACANMEITACANGLGVFYSSFITRGADTDKVKKAVGVPDGKKVFMAFVTGYPDVQYKRTAPRKKANIVWA
jgi:nitroreductase/NAD-dependent dihydropyrimidine dehydrogenase PreA subunit